MSREIWRFHVKNTPHKQTIMIPLNAMIINAGWKEGDGINIWAIVDPSLTREMRFFKVMPTGQPLPDDCDELGYVGVAFQNSSTYFGEVTFVWHVFEVDRYAEEVDEVAKEKKAESTYDGDFHYQRKPPENKGGKA